MYRKGYRHLDNTICNNTELDEATRIMPTYPADTEWLIVINVKINTVDPTTMLNLNNLHPIIKYLTTKTHVFDENLQIQRITGYKLEKHLKQQ